MRSHSGAKNRFRKKNQSGFLFWLNQITEWFQSLFKIDNKLNRSNMQVLAVWESRDETKKLFKITRHTPGAIATYQIKFQNIPDRIQIGIDSLSELRLSLLKRQSSLGESYKKHEADIGLFESMPTSATHRIWLQHIWRSPSTQRTYQQMRWILDFDAQQREFYEKPEAIAQYIALYYLNLYYPNKDNPIPFALQEDLVKVVVKACKKELGERYNHVVIKHLPREERKVKPLTRIAS